MVISPRQSGVVAICDCGSKQFIPSDSAVKTGILYCPCGHLEKVGKEVINRIMDRSLRAHIAKKSGQLYRPPAKSEERHREQTWFEEIG